MSIEQETTLQEQWKTFKNRVQELSNLKSAFQADITSLVGNETYLEKASAEEIARVNEYTAKLESL